MRKERIGEQELRTAIAWLQANEAGDEEQEDCEAVARFLQSKLTELCAAAERRYLRKKLREAGLPYHARAVEIARGRLNEKRG